MDTPNHISPAHFRRLLEISAMLSSTLDLEKLLSLVIEASAEVTNTEEASLLLFDEKENGLRFVATSNDPRLLGLIVPMDSLAGWCLRQEESFILSNVWQDPRHYDRVAQFTDKSTSEMLVVPLKTKGQTIGVVEAINKLDGQEATAQDIALLEALASQAAVAIENARLFQQSDAIADVMHELKTPLLAITAATELLLRPQLPLAQHNQIVQHIHQEARRMTQLTQDFLELSRWDSGRTKLNWGEVDVTQLIGEVRDIQQPQASQRGIQIDLQPPSSPLTAVEGDYDRLKQVLLNLLSNAIKYNREEGRITLAWGAANASTTPFTANLAKEEMRVFIAITDEGPGIPADQLSRLFDRFYRLPGSEGFSEGAGLGLSIAQKIVAAHGGKLLVTSALGVGTTFWVCLR